MSEPGAATSAVLFDLKQLARFSERGPEAVILAETGGAQIVLLGMRAGQEVREVRTASQVVAQCLRGRARLWLGAAPLEVRAGLVALIEAGATHSFSATTDCVLLLTLTPSPERQSPAHDLLAELRPLVVRDAPPGEA